MRGLFHVLRSDLLDLFEGIASGTLSERHVDVDDRTAVTIVLASDGYPGSFEKGVVINGLDTYEVNYPTGPDSGEKIAVDYGVSGVPETFVVDAEGNMVAHLPGAVTSIRQLQDMVDEARK